MHVSAKGRVTIPQEIRTRLGLLPYTEVEFELVGDYARIRRARGKSGATARGRMAVELLRGSAGSGMSTDEILALTRGELGGVKSRARRK